MNFILAIAPVFIGVHTVVRNSAGNLTRVKSQPGCWNSTYMKREVIGLHSYVGLKYSTCRAPSSTSGRLGSQITNVPKASGVCRRHDRIAISTPDHRASNIEFGP